MPVEAPKLNTRSFDDLVAEARLRIPRYMPDWTDFNESDPGITLIELFAWFTETMLVEMDRVPERNYIKFLALLGMQSRPAIPATAHLTFTPTAGQKVSVPKGSQIAAQADSGTLIFETEEGLDLVGLPLTDVVVFDGAGFQTATAANESGTSSFRPLGWVPAVGSALYLGFTQVEPPMDKPFPRDIKLRVFLPLSAGALTPQNANEVRISPPSPVDLVWEHRPASNTGRWQRLSLFSDDSLAFTQEGYMSFQGPDDPAATVEANVADPRVWLRCRLDRKNYPAGKEPEIAFIRLNTVDAHNLATVRNEILLKSDGSAQSDGAPNQEFALRRKPVFVPQPDDGVSGSLELSFEPPNGSPETWKRVEDFLASTRDDPHYTLDPTAGTIRTGDGTNGRIPSAGGQFVALAYRWGGGTSGNLGPDSITAPMTSLTGVEKVTNQRPAFGGRDQESIDSLKSTAPHKLRSRNRAVSSEDFAAIAQEVGGIERATALPLAHPDHPGVEVAGAITVVIVPDVPDITVPNPLPSADQITAVCRYLDGFRLLTTELFVAAPGYVQISVQATVQAQQYASPDTVANDVEKRINAYLDPLGRKKKEVGLPEDEGWKFGDPLHPTNLFAVILGVKDVIQVPRLDIMVDSVPHEDLPAPVNLPAGGLFYGSGHQINVLPV